MLDKIDKPNRRATCSRCGLVTIKVDTNRPGGWKCTRQLIEHHRLDEIDLKSATAWCRGCQKRVEIIHKQGDRWWCKVGARASQAKDRTEHGEKRRATMAKWSREHGRNWRILRTYGLTEDDYAALLAEQGGVCASCKGGSNGPGAINGFFVVDHDHIIGINRGLLCSKCNTALGLLNDDPALVRALLEYILRACQVAG